MTVAGGDKEALSQYLQNLTQQHGHWQGYYQGDLAKLMTFLPDLDAKLLHLNLARASLEDYFIRQLRERGITTSQ